MVVWKAKISAVQQEITVCIPKGAKFLTARDQLGFIALWYSVPDIYAPLVEESIVVCSTGGLIDANYSYDYLGTIHEMGLVLHVFRRIL